MKKLYLLVLLSTCLLACTDKKKKEDEKMIPVEADNGIGDGAPSLDSLLEYRTPPVSDTTLLNKPKDTILQ
ncbi:MAG: hypothetical protein MK211_06405 [Flavobacteriales bacterium]|nr:hypothetical protein [Flavobacteriales bacterium]